VTAKPRIRRRVKPRRARPAVSAAAFRLACELDYDGATLVVSDGVLHALRLSRPWSDEERAAIAAHRGGLIALARMVQPWHHTPVLTFRSDRPPLFTVCRGCGRQSVWDIDEPCACCRIVGARAKWSKLEVFGV
jgi:ribosomal protein L37E